MGNSVRKKCCPKRPSLTEQYSCLPFSGYTCSDSSLAYIRLYILQNEIHLKGFGSLTYLPTFNLLISYTQKVKAQVFSSPGLLKEQRRKHDTKAAGNSTKQFLNVSSTLNAHILTDTVINGKD